MSLEDFPDKVALRVEAIDPGGCVRGWYAYIDREKDTSWEVVYKKMGVMLGMDYDQAKSVTLQIQDFLKSKGFKSPAVLWITQKDIDNLSASWDTVGKGKPQLGIPGPDEQYKYFEED